MRCVLVNGAKLKAEAQCANCGRKIGGDGYVREIRTHRVYCDFQCYSAAVQISLEALTYRMPTLTAWKRSS
jgi:hypothetical protein